MDINLSDSFVEFTANTANVKSKLVEVEVPDLQAFTFKNGMLLVLDLQDNAGSEISADSRIYVGAKNPVEMFPKGLAEKSYRPYSELTISEQYNDEKNGKCKIYFETGKNLKLLEGDKFSIWVNSADVVDETNSTVEITDVDKQSLR
jgi:hypothetical protein